MHNSIIEQSLAHLALAAPSISTPASERRVTPVSPNLVTVERHLYRGRTVVLDQRECCHCCLHLSRMAIAMAWITNGSGCSMMAPSGGGSIVNFVN